MQRTSDFRPTDFPEDEHKCSICGNVYRGFGNNAYPLDGRCCDDCQVMHVVPARLKQVYLRQRRRRAERGVTLAK